MKKSKGFHHGNLKNEIIRQGLNIIKDEGIRNISLRKITDKCGVSSPSAYRHFKNKQELLDILFFEVSEIFTNYLAVINEDVLPKKRLTEMGVNFVYFSKDYPNYYEFLFQSSYVVPLKVDMNEINLVKPQGSFNLFKKEVNNYLDYYQIEGNQGQHLLHLWAYISGLAMIVSGKSTPFVTKELIQEQIEAMLKIYTQGSKHVVESSRK